MATIIFKGETFTFDPGKFMNVELMHLEQVSRKIGYPLTSGQWQDELNEMGMTALTLLVYMLKKRQNPKFQFEDMPDFGTDDFDIKPVDVKDVTAEPAPLEQTSVEMSGSQIDTNRDNLNS
jgi:hypothetical protein